MKKDKDRDKERGRLVARTTSARGVATPTPTRAVRASVCFEEQREATSLDLWITHVDRESILCGLKKTIFLVLRTCKHEKLTYYSAYYCFGFIYLEISCLYTCRLVSIEN